MTGDLEAGLHAAYGDFVAETREASPPGKALSRFFGELRTRRP